MDEPEKLICRFCEMLVREDEALWISPTGRPIRKPVHPECLELQIRHDAVSPPEDPEEQEAEFEFSDDRYHGMEEIDLDDYLER